MFDQLSASALTALLPNLTYELPVLGEVNFQSYVMAAIVFVGLTIFFWILRMVVLRHVKVLAQKTSSSFDDMIIDAVDGIRAWVYTIVALYISLQFFTLPDALDKVIVGVFLFAIVWQAIEVASCFVNYFVTQFLEKDEDGDGEIDPNSANSANLVTLISRLAMWSFGAIFVLSNLGVEVTSLIAGLGIGGIAIAFALQGVLSDLFASFSLYFDKPFRIGDFIVIGDNSGKVERIGIKTTRLRTLQGEELVVSNTELTTARVQNFKKMQERRIVSTFGITYETPQERTKEVPGIVKRIFESLEGAHLDRVHLTSFGDFALIYELVYYVESSDYSEYLDLQQSFNFDLMKRFAELGIEFAYPTQMLYTKSVS